MRIPPQSWMFPYVEACRKVGVLELESGDVLDLRWEDQSERPSPAPPGHGSHRCIVIRVNRAWHGYAEKVVVSLMNQDLATTATANGPAAA
jgi:hypothetical protein